MSTTPISAAPSRAARIRAWCRPRCPTPITAALTASATLLAPGPPDDRDAGFVGRPEHLIAVNDERPAGVDGQGRGIRRAHGLDRRDADHRHVEPHVLL